MNQPPSCPFPYSPSRPSLNSPTVLSPHSPSSLPPPPCRYDEEDEALLQQADADVLSERRSAMDEWASFRASKQEFVALSQGFKAQMFGPRWAEKESLMVKQVVEQVVESKEELYLAK